MFKSDNTWGVSPPILTAIFEANTGSSNSYGQDNYSAKLRERLSEIFEKEIDLYLTSTGTAANCLSLASITAPYGNIYCHIDSHINVDECGAPELATGGAKLVPIPGEHGKINPHMLKKYLKTHHDMRPHQGLPSSISLTQANESGCVYKVHELQKIHDIASHYSIPIHMDGARFANALASLNCSPKDITWKSGVDVLSFGGTKNGALAAEAVIFFNKQNKHADFIHKKMGQLLSKTRFFSAQFLAYLAEDLWLNNAKHANTMALQLREILLSHPQIVIDQPTEINEVFAEIPQYIVNHLKKSGIEFYQWPEAPELYRFVTSFMTQSKDLEIVKKLIDELRKIL